MLYHIRVWGMRDVSHFGLKFFAQGNEFEEIQMVGDGYEFIYGKLTSSRLHHGPTAAIGNPLFADIRCKAVVDSRTRANQNLSLTGFPVIGLIIAQINALLIIHTTQLEACAMNLNGVVQVFNQMHDFLRFAQIICQEKQSVETKTGV